jgi:hypothetical protein
MKKRARILRVFVASPGDTIDERRAVAEVVAELNKLHGRTEGFRLDLLLWEEDAYPGVGADAQDVVNRQIGDYDIFIGLMKTRFGSPTGRANSGTEEEFNRALERHLQDDGRPKILFYFGDPPVRLSSIDLYQALEIRRFRERVGRLGILYWPYETPDQFRRLLANHLLQTVRETVRNQTTPSPRPRAGESGNTLTVRLADWHASTERIFPQWASYRDVPLEQHSHTGFSLTGVLDSPSPYFRFGFKLLTPEGRRFGDGAIQSYQDNNLLVHLGKNEALPHLFLTTYYNGVRQALDRPLVRYEPHREITVSVGVMADGLFRLFLDSEEMHRAQVSPALTKRLMLIAWGDEHEYELDFRNIDLQLTTR